MISLFLQIVGAIVCWLFIGWCAVRISRHADEGAIPTPLAIFFAPFAIIAAIAVVIIEGNPR